MLAKINKQKSS